MLMLRVSEVSQVLELKKRDREGLEKVEDCETFQKKKMFEEGKVNPSD